MYDEQGDKLMMTLMTNLTHQMKICMENMPLEELDSDEDMQSFFPVSKPTKALLQMS